MFRPFDGIGSGADVLDAKNAAGFRECFGGGGIKGPIIARHVATSHALAVDPGLASAQKSDGTGLLIVSNHLDLCDPYCVVVREMVPLAGDACGTAMLQIADNKMAHLAKAF